MTTQNGPDDLTDIPQLQLSKVPKVHTSLINKSVQDMPEFLLGRYTQTEIGSPLNSCGGGKKVFPSHKHGYSYESPTYFQNRHSLLCKDSYNNPFISNKVTKTVQPNAFKNKEFFKVQEQNYEKKRKNFNFLIEQKIEPFTEFVEKNDVMNVFGPLSMRERPKNFRPVKEYQLSKEQQKKVQEARQSSLHNFYSQSPKKYSVHTSPFKTMPTNQSNIMSIKSCPVSYDHRRKLRKIQKVPKIFQDEEQIKVDEEKYLKNDPIYFNQIQNQIIKQKIKESVKYQCLNSPNRAYVQSNKYPPVAVSQKIEDMQQIITQALL